MPGGASAQLSCRSETLGLCGVIFMVNLVCKIFNIAEGTATVGCNGAEALKSAFCEGGWREATIEQADFDIISLARAQLKKSPITWKWRHVKGRAPRR